jgi:hypothetical protein
MQNPKSGNEKPTAREQALSRRVFDVGEILGMRHMPPIVFDVEKKPKVPESPTSE